MPSVDETGAVATFEPPSLRVALIVDPDHVTASRFARIAERCGLRPLRVSTGAQAIEKLPTAELAVVILDSAVADVPAHLLLANLTAVQRVPVIVASVTPTLRTGVDLTRAGAADVLDKRAAPEEIEAALRAVLSRPTPLPDNASTDRRRAVFLSRYTDLFRRSASMRAVEEMVARVANVHVPVLLRGEPGVGKELVAVAIHYLSDRGRAPFVKVACASLPPGLIETEIFGDGNGAAGKVDIAVEGTVFLDEIADVPTAVQSRLVRLLDDGMMDVRLIAATTADVYALVAAGQIRSDLYERLSVATITVPPLRERPEEIDFLVGHFLERFSTSLQRPIPAVSDATALALRTYEWPGNVRELEHMIKRWIVLGVEADVRNELEMRRASINRMGTRGATAPGLREIGRQAAREAERRALQDALARTNGNRSAAARALKVTYKTLLQKLTSTGVAPPKGRSPSD